MLIKFINCFKIFSYYIHFFFIKSLFVEIRKNIEIKTVDLMMIRKNYRQIDR